MSGFHQELNITLILRNSVSARHWGEFAQSLYAAGSAQPFVLLFFMVAGAVAMGLVWVLATQCARNLALSAQESMSCLIELNAGSSRARVTGAAGLGAFAGIWVFGRYGVSWPSLFFLSVLCVLLMLAVIDCYTWFLPDALTLPLLWAGLLLAWSGQAWISLHQAVGGAMLGYGFLWILNHVFMWVRGKQGMGYGDFKLTAALGAWLGYAFLPLVLLTASGLGLLWVCVRTRRETFLGDVVPFGPFLALSGGAALFML